MRRYPLGLWQTLALRLLAPVLLVFAGGCVSTGFDFVSEEDLAAGYTDTVTDSAGVQHVVVYEPRRKVTRKRAHYDDTTGAGKVAGMAMDGLGSLGAMIPGGWGTVAASGLALLGIGGAGVHKISKNAGENKEWERQESLRKAAAEARVAMYEEERRTGKDLNKDGTIGAPTT